MKHTKSPKKNKFHYINEIINIMKKHNLSIYDIIHEYIYKYEVKFNNEERIINKQTYQNILMYHNLDKNLEKSNWLNDFTIIDNYDEFMLL